MRLTDGAGYRSILAIHTARHPETGAERLAAEVKDFLRRVAGLVPDLRTAEDGGLDGVTPRHLRDASTLMLRTTLDITQMLRET